MDLRSVKVVETQPGVEARPVPDHVSPLLSELFVSAQEAYQLSKYQAAAFILRRVLNLASIHLNRSKEGLKARIAALHADGLLSDEVAALAGSVRIEGDEQEEDWTEEDARRLIEFVCRVLEEAFTVPAQRKPEVLVLSSGRGSRLETYDIVRSRGSAHPYRGPVYDGALWLKHPRLLQDGSVEASVCWDRCGRDWDRIVIGRDGVVLTSELAADLMLLLLSNGQSLGQGGTVRADAAAYTTSAVDAGNALMFEQGTFLNPYVGAGKVLRRFTDLQHVLNSGYGETHLGSFAMRMLASMATAGAKIPGVYWTKANGGHSLRDLREDIDSYLPNGKIGGCWQDLMMSVNDARHEVVSAHRKRPVVMPMIFIHGEEDSGWPGLSAMEYAAGLKRVADTWNTDLRRICDWSPSAPDLPIIITQTNKTRQGMYRGTVPDFRRGVDGPRLAQWAMPYQDGRFVLAGPHHHLPTASDYTHLTPASYFRLGEQLARHFWACTFGSGPLRFNPLAVIRQSQKEFDIVFTLPSGALQLDTANVSDAGDGQKGFVCWDNVANARIDVSAVSVVSADTVRVTLSEPVGRDAEMWCDYAVWADESGRARGNLRTDTPHPSWLGKFGGPDIVDYDWCPAFRVRVPFWGGAQSTWMVDGTL